MLPHSSSDVQPILVLSGLILRQDKLVSLTRDFVRLKKAFSPNISLPYELDFARYEMKGADLRRDIRKGNRNSRRHVFRFLDDVLALLDSCDAKFVTRIYIKKPGDAFDGKAAYTSSVQAMCEAFQAFLEEKQSEGFVIADSRTPNLNSIVSHSIFTQKFRVRGDPYSRILEMPVFGHSENHAMLQVADFLSSSMLFPIVSNVYCNGHINSVHVHPKDKYIREMYALRMKALSYRFHKRGRFRGGITVTDAIASLPSSRIFAGLSALPVQNVGAGSPEAQGVACVPAVLESVG